MDQSQRQQRLGEIADEAARKYICNPTMGIEETEAAVRVLAAVKTAIAELAVRAQAAGMRKATFNTGVRAALMALLYVEDEANKLNTEEGETEPETHTPGPWCENCPEKGKCPEFTDKKSLEEEEK